MEARIWSYVSEGGVIPVEISVKLAFLNAFLPNLIKYYNKKKTPEKFNDYAHQLVNIFHNDRLCAYIIIKELLRYETEHGVNLFTPWQLGINKIEPGITRELLEFLSDNGYGITKTYNPAHTGDEIYKSKNYFDISAYKNADLSWWIL